MKESLNEMEEVFRLMREMLAEVEGLKHIMTDGTTTISEKAHKKVQDMVEKAFNPLEPIKLSQEAFNKIEEIDNTPLTEKELESIKKFKERVNKFYGTVEDKGWIQEKCNTNTPPTFVPEHPSKGNIKSKTTDNSIRTKEEVEDKLKQLTIAFKYAVLDRDKIQGWIEALEWMMKKHEN